MISLLQYITVAGQNQDSGRSAALSGTYPEGLWVLWDGPAS